MSELLNTVSAILDVSDFMNERLGMSSFPNLLTSLNKVVNLKQQIIKRRRKRHCTDRGICLPLLKGKFKY